LQIFDKSKYFELDNFFIFFWKSPLPRLTLILSRRRLNGATADEGSGPAASRPGQNADAGVAE
jgi:hypothetical protein